jgi:hypothetical protein
LLQEQDTLKDLPNKSLYKQGQLAILDVTNEIQASTQGTFLREKVDDVDSVGKKAEIASLCGSKPA